MKPLTLATHYYSLGNVHLTEVLQEVYLHRFAPSFSGHRAPSAIRIDEQAISDVEGELTLAMAAD